MLQPAPETFSGTGRKFGGELPALAWTPISG